MHQENNKQTRQTVIRTIHVHVIHNKKTNELNQQYFYIFTFKTINTF